MKKTHGREREREMSRIKGVPRRRRRKKRGLMQFYLNAPRTPIFCFKLAF